MTKPTWLGWIEKVPLYDVVTTEDTMASNEVGGCTTSEKISSLYAELAELGISPW